MNQSGIFFILVSLVCLFLPVTESYAVREPAEKVWEFLTRHGRVSLCLSMEKENIRNLCQQKGFFQAFSPSSCDCSLDRNFVADQTAYIWTISAFVLGIIVTVIIQCSSKDRRQTRESSREPNNIRERLVEQRK